MVVGSGVLGYWYLRRRNKRRNEDSSVAGIGTDEHRMRQVEAHTAAVNELRASEQERQKAEQRKSDIGAVVRALKE